MHDIKQPRTRNDYAGGLDEDAVGELYEMLDGD